MVPRIEKFTTWTKTIVVSIMATLSSYLIDYVDKHVTFRLISFIIVITAFIIAISIVQAAIEYLIDSSIWLRRQVLGRQFVEGYWIDKVIEQSTEKILAVSIFRISYSDNQLISSGVTYDLSGRKIGNFRTYISQYGNYKLKYAYDGKNIKMPNLTIYGHGEYDFTECRRAPNNFTGYLYDTNHREAILLQATKITDKQRLKTIDNEDTRQYLIKRCLE